MHRQATSKRSASGQCVTDRYRQSSHRGSDCDADPIREEVKQGEGAESAATSYEARGTYSEIGRVVRFNSISHS
jgi:hypothetical protein